MKSIDLTRWNAKQTSAAASEPLSVRGSAAVIGLTSLLLWAGIVWIMA